MTDPVLEEEAPQSRADAVLERVLSRAGTAVAEGGTQVTNYDGDQFEREERAALRRVGSLSTELEDVTEVEYRQLQAREGRLGWACAARQHGRRRDLDARTRGARGDSGLRGARRPASAPAPTPTPPRTSARARRKSSRRSSRRLARTPSSSTTISRRASAARLKTWSRSRSLTAPRSSLTSLRSTPSPRRARRRSSSPSSSTCCRGSAVGVNRCPARPVARWAAPRREWALADPVRPRSS